MNNMSPMELKPFYKLLSEYSSIDLSYLEKNFSTHKNEFKFVFHKELLPDLLKLLKNTHHILVVKHQYHQLYKTYYYDTPAFDMYYQAYLKKNLRYKIRWRNYIDTNTGFLEIKNKKNTYNIHKYKISLNQFPEKLYHQPAFNFIQTHSPFNPKELYPVIFTRYYRITLIHKNHFEKVTIDINLSFNNFQEEKKFNNPIILEIKTTDTTIPIEISNTLKKLNINKKIISKYSIGMALMHNNIKKNIFLPYLKLLEIMNRHTLT